jgi:uncharacterized protein YvpB
MGSLIASILIIGGFSYYFLVNKNKIDISNEIKDQAAVTIPATKTETPPSEVKSAKQDQPAASPTEEKPLPDKIVLNVPFQVQAPGANWDALHEDACEEASLMMVYHYNSKTSLGGDEEIKSLVQWETDNSYGLSITLEELSQIAKSYYQISGARIETSITIDKIKSEIAAGKPVIIPAAGKVLPNPNFSNGGPNYHMLVVTGYDSQNFITNDPGTRKGEGFVYKYNDLINSIHDWDEDNILNGQKAYLVFN